METQYDDNFFNVVKDKSIGSEIGTLGYSMLMASHSKVVYTKSTYWTGTLSDDEYSLHES